MPQRYTLKYSSTFLSSDRIDTHAYRAIAQWKTIEGCAMCVKNECDERFARRSTVPSSQVQEHVNEFTSSCCKVLATPRRSRMTPQDTKKSLVQSLVLSKLTYLLPTLLQKRVQLFRNAAAAFVLNRFCSKKDVLRLSGYLRWKILNSAFLSLDTEFFLVKLGPNTCNCQGTIPNVHCALAMRL